MPQSCLVSMETKEVYMKLVMPHGTAKENVLSLVMYNMVIFSFSSFFILLVYYYFIILDGNSYCVLHMINFDIVQ